MFFTRAPHLECSAKSDDAGVATCRLEDAHAHSDGEHEDEEAPTVASYGALCDAIPSSFRRLRFSGNDRRSLTDPAF